MWPATLRIVQGVLDEGPYRTYFDVRLPLEGDTKIGGLSRKRLGSLEEQEGDKSGEGKLRVGSERVSEVSDAPFTVKCAVR